MDHHQPPGRATSAAPAEALSLGSIYRDHHPRMLREAVRLVGSADAQDVVHDVFLRLPQALDGFDGRGPLGAWLRRMTVRAALLRIRRERRRLKWQDRAATESPTVARPAAVEVGITLERAVARMPSHLRAVYVLKEVEGYRHAEIAARLGITANASEVRLHRARHYLRERLRGRV